MTGASLFMVSLMVPNMDDAILHYTRDWGFALANDSRHVSGHRWVVVAPKNGANLRLIEANNDAQHAVIGRQVADKVAFFLYVAQFDAALARWAASGIEITEPARLESYGRVAVLKDKYGNRWDAFDSETKGNL